MGGLRSAISKLFLSFSLSLFYWKKRVEKERENPDNLSQMTRFHYGAILKITRGKK